MKVFVVMENNWQDHEGGGGEIHSIHATWDAAFKAVKKLHRPRRLNPKKTEWNYRTKEEDERSASHDWTTIDEHEVLGI
jgi:hypothetical protein